jgi:hypothetical protein
MIRHVALFAVRPDLPAAEEAALFDELRALPGRHPQMQRFGVGENRSGRDRSFTHVMSAEFESFALLDAYLEGAHHERFVKTRFLPSVTARAIASYEIDAP